MSKSYGPDNPEFESLQAKIAAGERVMAKFMAGRELARIDGYQMPADFHFPAAVGEILTEDSIHAIVAAVRAFDPGLETGFFPINDKEAGVRIVKRQ